MGVRCCCSPSFPPARGVRGSTSAKVWLGDVVGRVGGAGANGTRRHLLRVIRVPDEEGVELGQTAAHGHVVVGLRRGKLRDSGVVGPREERREGTGLPAQTEVKLITWGVVTNTIRHSDTTGKRDDTCKKL